MINFCIVIQGRVILEELIPSVPLSQRAIIHITLPRETTGCSLYWEVNLFQRAILKELSFNIPFLRII